MLPSFDVFGSSSQNNTERPRSVTSETDFFWVASPAASGTQKAAPVDTKSGASSGDADKPKSTESALDSFDSVDSPVRWLGLLGRLRTVVIAQSRLLAYTSEVGEAFRPIASPLFVTGAYAVSWAYVLGDVGFEAYKMRSHGASDLDVARTGIERGIFQSLASMMFPAYTVHFVVHQSAALFKSVKPGALKRFGPSGLGLATIPFLPLIFDHPTEIAMEYVFDKVWPLSAQGMKAKEELHRHEHREGHVKTE